MSRELTRNDVTGRIIHAFFDVYNEPGPGFLESVYEAALGVALATEGVVAERQACADVYYRGSLVGLFRADIIVERSVVVELKAARALESAHEAQLLNYLRATSIDIGILLNFGSRPTFKRMVYTRRRVRPFVSARPTP